MEAGGIRARFDLVVMVKAKVREVMQETLFELNVAARLPESAKEVVNFSCLDLPRDGQVFQDKIVFSGWLLGSVPGQLTSIVIKNGGHAHPVGTPVERRDVLSKVLGINDAELPRHPQLRCGFSIELAINPKSPIEIYFEVDGVLHLWTTLGVQASKFDYPRLQSFWRGYSTGEPVVPADLKFLRTLDSLSNDVISRVLMGEAEVVGLKAVEARSGWLARGKKLIDYLTAEDFACHALETALSHGAIVAPNPFGYGVALCRHSFTLPGNINVLMFRAPSQEAFFVLQHVSSADAIYFPAKNLVVLVKHLPAESVRNAMVALLKGMQDEALTEPSDERQFLGAIASHGRPYHFYYDVAPAIQGLHEADILYRLDNIYYYEGADFCSYKDVYQLPANEQTLNAVALQAHVARHNGYVFHVGTLFDRGSCERLTRFDDEFLRFSRGTYKASNDAELSSMSECYPLIWFGITVQKRSWLEQVEAAQNLMNELQKTYPKVGVVFDGWTSPLNPTAADKSETAKDNLVVAEVASKLNPSIPVFSAVGATSTQKIAYARVADAYVGNSGTGGLHVARFAGRPGVGHLNTKMIDSDEHVRRRTRLVDKKFIVDRPEDADLRRDFISYSLDWRVVHGQLVEILNSRGE